MLSSTKSRNAGKTFLQTLLFLLLVNQICFAQWYQQNSGTAVNLNSVHFENANNGWAVGDGGTIIRTTNGGTNWITQTSGTTQHLQDICFIDVNTGWAVGTSSVLWPFPLSDSSIILRTTDGGTSWARQLHDITHALLGIFFADANYGWAVGGDGTILRTTNGGTTWTLQTSGTTNYLFGVYFTDVNNGWAVGDAGTILNTTDGGNNWTEQTSGTYSFLYSVCFADANKGFAVGGHGSPSWSFYGEILGTTDGGINWSTLVGTNDILYRSVYFSDANNGIVVGAPGPMSAGAGFIFRTTDAGANWIEQTSDTINRFSGVYSIDALTSWVVGHNGTILHTTNGGVPVELTSFTATSNGKEVILNWTTATELNNQGFEIERSTEGKEFFTVGFVNGHGITTELQNYSYADRNLDDGNYQYRLKQVDYDGSYEYSDVVEVEWRSFNLYLLEQNYPNPFNPTTTIGFGLQNKSNVKITILNSIGEEIAVVLNEEREQGFHQVEFNAANLPSGVYFYQLRAGDFISTKKMLLLK